MMLGAPAPFFSMVPHQLCSCYYIDAVVRVEESGAPLAHVCWMKKAYPTPHCRRSILKTTCYCWYFLSDCTYCYFSGCRFLQIAIAAASADFCKRTTEDDILLLSENGWDFFKRQISKASESFAIHIVHFLLCSILVSLCSHIFSNFWKHRTWLSSHNQESGGGGDHQHINVTSLRVLLTPLKARTLMIWGEPEGKMRAGANEDLWSYSPDISHMVPQKSSAFSTFA